MKINWTVRLRNKNWWMAIIPALLLLVQQVLNLFGVTIDTGDIGQKLISLVETAFVILTLIGVVNDPTTKGLEDSDRAMTYEEPN